MVKSDNRQLRIDRLRAAHYKALGVLNAEHTQLKRELAVKTAARRAALHSKFRTALDELRRAA